MKKLISILLVVMAVPAFAAPTLDLVDLGGGEVALDYTTDGNLVSGFGVEISVSAGSISDFVDLGDLEGYWVHPSNIVIDDVNGVVDSEGSAIASTTASSIVVEFGALYEKGVDADPAASGRLCTFKVSENCTVTASSNTVQGGIVTEGELMSYTDVSDELEVAVSAGCATCGGDTDGNNQVDLTDLTNLVNKLSAAGSPFIVSVTAGVDDCYDTDGNSQIDLTDLTNLVNTLSAAGSPFIVPCQ